MRNDPSTAAEAKMPANFLPHRPPKKMFSTAPMSGSSGIQRSRLVVMSRPSNELPLQELHVPGIEGLAEAKDRDHDREPDDRLRGRHGHDEKHDHLDRKSTRLNSSHVALPRMPS